MESISMKNVMLTKQGGMMDLNPIKELLIAYAIVHLDLRGERARQWGEMRYLALFGGN
jgi:hypothetical protein